MSIAQILLNVGSGIILAIILFMKIKKLRNKAKTQSEGE
jgi:hypothetical protein